MYLWISLVVLLLSFLLLNISSDPDEKDASLNLKFGSSSKERESTKSDNYGSTGRYEEDETYHDEDDDDLDRDVSKDDD